MQIVVTNVMLNANIWVHFLGCPPLQKKEYLKSRSIWNSSQKCGCERRNSNINLRKVEEAVCNRV